MIDVLSLCAAYPERRFAKGEILLEEAVRTDRLYVLKSGGFDVVRGGVAFVHIGLPGAFLGEISAVLEGAPSATLVASEDSCVYVIDNASAEVRARPELTLAVAQVLARRLLAVTGYLVDIKRQYAGTGTHLALMDKVLAELASQDGAEQATAAEKLGSERPDVPDY
ncbi:MAG: Crp/Fnr family transcriptional regulator [Pseudomarimonas sp.]